MIMKYLLATLAIILSLQAKCQEDYILNINGASYNVSLDKEYNIQIGGKNINFIFKQKDTLFYSDELYSFQYPKGVKVSKTKIDEGIEQIAIMTAEGSGLIIQSYTSINPTLLNEIMLNELTKESISYGYESKRINYKRNLKSGKEIDVNKAELTYKDDINIYEVASIGKKDSGIIIVTMRMDKDLDNEGQKIIDLMWKSLKLNW